MHSVRGDWFSGSIPKSRNDVNLGMTLPTENGLNHVESIVDKVNRQPVVRKSPVPSSKHQLGRVQVD